MHRMATTEERHVNRVAGLLFQSKACYLPCLVKGVSKMLLCLGAKAGHPQVAQKTQPLPEARH